MKTIKEFEERDHIFGQFLVIDCKKGVTANSKSYLTITFQDATGTIEGKRWDYFEGEDKIFAISNVVNIEAEVIEYKDKLQLKVLGGEVVPAENVDAARLVPSSPVSKEELEKKLDAYIDSIKNEDALKILKAVMDKFRKEYVSWPAAVRNHHNYVSGLLQHSITMADMAEKVCQIYPSLNRDILITGTLIHDIGKTIELSGAIATQFTLEGKLLGHISIMMGELRKIIDELGMNHNETAICIEHMILSHHNKPEFGSPVPPLTREALALAYIDDLDAKMAILDKAYNEIKPGEFTSRLNNMDERYFYYPNYDEIKD